MKRRASFWRTLRTLGKKYLIGETGGRVVFLFLFLSALAFVCFWVIRQWDVLISFSWQLKLGSLLGMIIMHLLASGSLFLSWHLMMRRLAGLRDWRRDFQIYSLSILSRRIPTPIWYVGSRLYLYRRNHVPAPIILSVTGVELILIGLDGLICYLLLLPWYTYTQQWPWQPLLAVWVVLVMSLVLRPNLLVDFINWMLQLLDRQALTASISRTDLLVWSLVYLATWFLDGIGLYYFVNALVPDPLGLVDALGVSTLSALVGLVILGLPVGLGLKELTMGVLLSLWMPVSSGIVVSVLYRLTQTVIEAVLALVGHQIGRRASKNDSIIQKGYEFQ